MFHEDDISRLCLLLSQTTLHKHQLFLYHPAWITHQHQFYSERPKKQERQQNFLIEGFQIALIFPMCIINEEERGLHIPHHFFDSSCIIASITFFHIVYTLMAGVLHFRIVDFSVGHVIV